MVAAIVVVVPVKTVDCKWHRHIILIDSGVLAG